VPFIRYCHLCSHARLRIKALRRSELQAARPLADSYHHTPGGWTVEVVQLVEGDRLRIRHHGFYVADVANVDDLARWIPAAELAQLEREPDTLIPAA